MTISLHAQKQFNDYALFSKTMDDLITKYPEISKCLYGRTKMEEFANRYFEGSDVICEYPKLSRMKIQNLYKIVEQSDLNLFFYDSNLKGGYMATSKSISRAKNLGKDFLVVEYNFRMEENEMDEMIKTVFSEMFDEIEKTNTAKCEPNRYHKTAAVSEVNLVYHFCKQFEKKSQKCAVYLEFPCDSGRVDAVVLYENNILLIEAKANLDNKKHKILNAQACRFENTRNHLILNSNEHDDAYLKVYLNDYSLRDTLKERVLDFMTEKFGVKDTINIYGILLSTAMNEYAKNKWDCHHNNQHFVDYKLDCIKNYTILDEKKDEHHSVWYLGAYKRIDKLDN